MEDPRDEVLGPDHDGGLLDQLDQELVTRRQGFGHPDFRRQTPDPSTKVMQFNTYPEHNARSHHTDKFSLVTDQQVCVWRRGQTVLVTVRTLQPWNIDTHSLRLVFDLGRGSSVPQGTKVVLSLEQDSHIDMSSTHQWGLQVQQARREAMVLEILIASNAAIGAYTLTVETALRSRPSLVNRFNVSEKFYVLFNPYCKDDTVFMPREEDLEEYLLSDVGKIYVGTHRRIRIREWIFGQFEDKVLEAAMLVLMRSNLPLADRADPVKVSRILSAMVNSPDDSGVLVGNWSGQYQDGTAPTDWLGSPAILEQYLEHQGWRPVKFGQCWVFSGVLTTLCRTLGIPCRPVTNFSSAHDTNKSLTVDRYFSSAGTKLKTHERAQGIGDSIWNFHVWNDVFMARPDLPRGYGGWQAIDATPQERSNNKYQTGPASVAAIKGGMIGLAYDVGFLFSEVNSDVVHFTEDPQSPWGFTRSNRTNTYHVGRKIVTKSVGEFDADYEDITPLYKFTEYDSTERVAMWNAVRQSPTASRIYGYRPIEGIMAALEEPEVTKFGETFRIKVNIENSSLNVRTLDVLISCVSIYYNGVKAHRVKEARGKFALQARERDSVILTVTPEEYLGVVVEHSGMMVTAMLKVAETNGIWTEEADFHLEKPRLEMQVEGDVRRRTVCRVRVTFRNPLNRRLTDGFFQLEAPGVVREDKHQFRDVEPKEQVEHVLTFQPIRAGSTRLLVSFRSGDLDIYGTLAVRVQP